MKPNVIMILIDDLGWMDLSCYGSTFYETPHIDALAKEGLLFKNAYAAAPVCSPTRAAILSGKYPANIGITQYIGGKSEGRLKHVPYLHYLPKSEKTLADSLKEGGYQTWHVGKWHLGDKDFYPTEHGFDVNIGGCHWGHPSKGYFAPYGIETLAEPNQKEYLTDRITQEALQLIENRDSEKPFYLNLWHYAVHTPIQAPEHLIQKYEKKAKDLKLDQIDPFTEGDHFSCLHLKDRKIKRRNIQSDCAYAAMIENLDDNIGKVIQALKDKNLFDDTIVIFTSDNGGLSTAEGSPTCNAPLSEGKGWNYEGGTRVCQIITYPKQIKRNQVSEILTTSTDFYPTLLEFAELPLNPHQHQDGISIKNTITHHSKLDRDAIYWHYPHYSNQGGTPSASMVTPEGWKLIHRFEDNHYELYHLPSDISEFKDLHQKPENQQRLSSMKTALKAWQTSIEAKIPETNHPDIINSLKPKVANNAYD